MKIKSILILGLFFGLIHSAMAETQSTNFLANFGDYPVGGNVPFISGAQEQPSGGKVVSIDPYTGKPVVHIPLLHVPVSAGLSLDLTVTNYQRLQFIWAQSTHNSTYYLDHKLGFNENIYPGVTTAKCGTNRPLFIDPQGKGHLFFASNQTANTFYSNDGWRGSLSAISAPFAENCHMTGYAGTIYSPDGTLYTISGGPGGFSPLTEVTTLASGGKAWIKYNYGGGYANENLASITTSTGYSVNFGYVSIPTSPDEHYQQFISQISTSDNKVWKFNYAVNMDDNQPAFVFAVLTQIILPDGTSWSFHNTGVIQPNPNLIYVAIFANITYPNGASQVFNYSLNSSYELGPYLVASEQDHNLPIDYTIQYAFWGDINPTTSTVTTPNSKKIYKIINDHPNNDMAWDSGLPIEEQIYDSSGHTLFKDTKFTWQPRQFSNDTGGSQAELTQRDITQDGATYTLQNTAFDDYGYPNNTVETSDAGKIQTTRAYYEDLTNWIFKPQIIKTMDANGVVENEVNNIYTQLGEVASTKQNGITTTYTYDDQGNLATQTDALNHQTSYGDYLAGQPQTTIDAMGNTSHKVMSNNGSVTSQTDPMGNQTTYSYNSMGQLSEIIQPNSINKTVIEWNNPKAGDKYIQYPSGYTKTIYNNGLGQPVETYMHGDPEDEKKYVFYSYDSEGNKTMQSFSYPNDNYELHGKIFSYDPLNRLIASNYNLNIPDYLTTYTYGPGNSVSVLAPLNEKTIYTYSAYGDPDDKQLISVQDANGNITNIKRNVIGQVLSIQQGNYTRSFNYNANNYLINETNPETGITTYGRDLLGNMTTKQIGSGGVVQYNYDADNRLSQIIYPDAANNITKTYDPDGHISTVKNSNATWTYGYDVDGNQTSAVASIGANTFAFNYQYSFDHLTEITYPNNFSLIYTLNAYGEQAFINTSNNVPYVVIQAQYYADGDLQRYFDGENEVKYTKNDRNMLNYYFVGSRHKIDLTYDYDAENNLTQLTRTVEGQSSVQNFQYNSVNELTGAQGPWGNASMSYDNLGNLTQMNVGDSQLNYQYDDHNRLTNINGTLPQAFIYDSQGNMLRANGYELAYNTANQLITAQEIVDVNHAVADQNAHSSAYAYDGNDNRISVTQDGNSSYEFYQGNTLLYTASATAPSINTSYVYLGGHLVAQVDNGQSVTRLYTDLLGSPILGISPSGDIWTQDYAPYGKELANLSQQRPDSHAGYTGKLNDSVSGLSYYNARYYDPAIGRFLSVDPAAVDPQSPMSFNRYAYANNNPYEYIDPTGMFSWNSFFGNAVNLLGQFAIGFQFGFSAGMLNVLADGIPIYNKPLYYTGEGLGTFAGLASGMGESMLASQAAERAAAMAEGGATFSGTNITPYWPGNNGFLGQTTLETLGVGTKIDRYGDELGKFAAPVGIPMQMRSLPPLTDVGEYNVYKVNIPFKVESGITAPAFGQTGLGRQFVLPDSISNLLMQGYLGRIN